ncbi:MAG TPA: hypothetical protein ENO18_07540 [Caldithrix sp.]|nr:hypothetical protein [Caldithrix sp.]
MIYIIITSLIFSVSDGIREGSRLQWHYDELHNNFISADQHNRAWHKWQFISNVSAVSLGFTIALDSYNEDKINWINVCFKTFLSGAIFYNVRDIAMNITRNREPFAAATHNYSGLKQFDFLKIPLLILSITINYLYDQDIIF